MPAGVGRQWLDGVVEDVEQQEAEGDDPHERGGEQQVAEGDPHATADLAELGGSVGRHYSYASLYRRAIASLRMFITSVMMNRTSPTANRLR